MRLKDVAKALSLTVEAAEGKLDKQVTGGYVGDLLSHVMAKAQPGDIWVTVQAHPNIVAVAVVAGLSGIVVAEGTVIDPTTIQKAEEEGVPMFSTPLTAFGTVAALAKAGINGTR